MAPFFTRQDGIIHTLIVGALEAAGSIRYTAGAETLWIRFKVGTFIPYIPANTMLNQEIILSEGNGTSFRLQHTVWQIPNFENADTFVNRLAREGVLHYDPFLTAALCDEGSATPDRTVRYRFKHRTGLSRGHIRQIERAERAAVLLQQGVSIPDTIHELGYFDQPHLTCSLKRFVGHTPRELSMLFKGRD